MFKMIAVATDGSEGADRALSLARDIASEQKSRLLVIHVDEFIPGRGGARHAQVMEPEIRTKLKDQVAALNAAGLEAQLTISQVAVHPAAHAIADEAKSAGAELIVVGTRGSGPLKGLLVGSVAHRLLHVAACPVLVVPPGDR